MTFKWIDGRISGYTHTRIRGARYRALRFSADCGGLGGLRDHAAVVSQNFTRLVPTLSLIGCYATSFYCLTFALNALPIAVVYATWSGLGIFLITVFGYLVFEQALDWRAIVGLLLIVAGVVLVNSFAPHK